MSNDTHVLANIDHNMQKMGQDTHNISTHVKVMSKNMNGMSQDMNMMSREVTPAMDGFTQMMPWTW